MKQGFSVDSEFNSQNVCHYAQDGKPPNFQYHRLDSHSKSTILAGCHGNGEIFGPFFTGENLSGSTYLQLIKDEIIPQLI